MNIFKNIILAIFFTGLLPFFSFAVESPQPCPSTSTFGCLEVGLPGNDKLAAGKPLDIFLDSPTPILDFIKTGVNVVIAALVIIGVISIVIGGYMYMTAGGNGDQVKSAKNWIQSALVGIFISLISVVLLNTINKYLGSEAQEPKLGGSPAPAAGGAANTNPQNSADTNPFPVSGPITRDSIVNRLEDTSAKIADFERARISIAPPDRELYQSKLNAITNQINQLEASNTLTSSSLQSLRLTNEALQERLDALP